MEQFCEVCGLKLGPRAYHIDDKIVCRKHYEQFRKYERFLDNLPFYTCEVCGRRLEGALHYADGKRVCAKHHGQFTCYGKFLDTNPRTEKDPNEIHRKKYKAYVDLYDKELNVCAQAIVDIEDVSLIEKYKWCMTTSNGLNYAVTFKKNKSIYMHRLVMDAKKDKEVDHINHNTLDNRKRNLRVTSHGKNMKNTAGLGVYYDSKYNKYYSQIMCDRIRVILKQYDTFEESKYSRWYAEKVLFKEYQYDKNEPENNLTDSRKAEIQEDTMIRIKKKFPDIEA